MGFTPLNPKVKIIENTGIAWSHIAMTNKPVDGPAHSCFLRFTVVLVRTGGGWIEACANFYEIPRRL